MADAGGKEVGRVSIRVVPNLDKFREELRKELEKWNEKTIDIDGDISKLKRKLDSIRDIDVAAKVDADKSAFDRAIRDADKDFTVEGVVDLDADPAEAVKKTKEAFKKSKPEVEPVAKLDRFQQRYLSQIQRIMSEFEVNVPLTADGEALRDKLKGQEKALVSKVKALDLNADFDELARLRREVDDFYQYVRLIGSKQALLRSGSSDKAIVDEVKRQLKAFSDAKDTEIDLRFKLDDFERSVQRAKAASEKTWRDLDVKLRIKVDEDGNIKRVWQGFAKEAAITAGSIARSFGSAFAGIGKIFSKFSPESLIQAAAILAAVAALATPAIALISGALLTLPAALSAIVVPAGVVALGMEGIKKAAETAKPAFDELKKSVSSVFETNLKPGFELIRDRLIPGLKLPLEGVAESLSTVFNKTIGTLTSPTGLQNLQRTVDNIGKAIRDAAPGVQSFTSGLTNLVANVSAKFPDLAQSFNNVGKDFDNWIAKITSNGQLNTALDTLKGTLSEIGGTIKDIAQWGFEQLADPQVGAQIRGFANDLRSIVNDILPALKSGFQELASIVGNIRDALDAVKDAADRIANILPKTKGDENILKDFKGLGIQPGSEEEILKKYFDPNYVASAAEKAGQSAAENFGKGLITSSVPGGDITQAIQTQLGQITNATNEAQKAALQSVFQGTGVGDAVKSQLSQQLQAVLTEAQTLVSTIGPQLQTALDTAIQPIKDMPAKIGESFGIAAGAVAGSFGPVVEAARAGASQVVSAMSSGFGNLYQTVAAAFQGVASAVNAGMTTAANVVATQVGAIIQAVSAGLAGLPGVVQAWFGTVPAVIQGAMSQAIVTVANVCGQIVQTMLSYQGAAENAGAAIGASFAKGLASQGGLVAESARILMDAARAFFPNSPADKGPFSGSGWIDKSGEAIANDFAGGIQGGIGQVVEIAKVLMQQVKDVFGNANGVVFNFNFNGATPSATSGLAGFGSQFASVAQSADKFQQSMTAAAPTINNLTSGETKKQLQELSQSLAELEIQRKQLELAKSDPGADQGVIKAQLEQIRLRKLELGLQKNQLDYANKYGGAQSQTSNAYADQIKKLEQMPLDFGKAVGNQFMSDLGWSGQGMFPQLLQQGLDYGSQFIFNVANMDDALSAKGVLQNKMALTTLGR